MKISRLEVPGVESTREQGMEGQAGSQLLGSWDGMQMLCDFRCTSCIMLIVVHEKCYDSPYGGVGAKRTIFVRRPSCRYAAINN